MDSFSLIALLLISMGGIIMFSNIFLCRANLKSATDLLANGKTRVKNLFILHQWLMGFFLAGYILVILTLIFDIQLVGTLFTGIIFFCGSLFVYSSISLQGDMLNSIRFRHEKILQQNKQLQQTENVTIFALAYQAEIRDGETGKHLERTSRYVQLLAEEMSKLPKYKQYLTDEYITDLVKSAPLHDIGKVGIPDSILQKPGKLTDEEFKKIQNHCNYGAKIIKEAEKKLKFKSFLLIAIKLIQFHHERWDGNGYPKGLKGEDIPLSARIMALADVYDALRSRRCYKEPFDHETTRDIIMEERGRQFDPTVVDAFLSTESQFRKTAEHLSD